MNEIEKMLLSLFSTNQVETNIFKMKRGINVLIHASSSTIPNYVMQDAPIPSKILEGIDRVNRNFLWGMTDHAKKMH